MKINTAFYPLYTQYLRQYYEISQKDLAKSTGISNSSLSKIEAGKQEMDEKTFKKLMEYFESLDYEFHFSFDLSFAIEAEKQIHKYVRSFLMMTYDSMIEELGRFLEKENYWHSFAFFHMEFLQILYDNFRDVDCTENVKSLIDLAYFQDDFHLAMLYDLYAVSISSMDEQVLKRQIHALKKALGYCQRTDETGLRGLILYHLILKQKTANDILALQHLEECEQCLEKAGAYRRLLYAKLNKGNVYGKFGLYPFAEEIYSNLEQSQSQINTNKDITPKIYECSSWCFLVQGKYEEAIKQAQKAESLHSRFPDIYITLAYGYYKLKDLEASKQSFSKAFFIRTPRGFHPFVFNIAGARDRQKKGPKIFSGSTS